MAGAALWRQVRRLRPLLRDGTGLGRRAFFNLARRYTPVLAVDRGEMRLFVSTTDRVIGRRLFVYPRADERDIGEAFAELRSRGGWTSGSVLEIGANIGSHTVEMVKRYGVRTVVAVEPDPSNFALLRQNVIANGLEDEVRMFELALSDRDHTVQLARAADNSGDHRVRTPATEATGEEARREVIEVQASRLDSLAERGLLDLESVDLIWMDAQGHEGQILAGASSLLQRGVPIVLEYWPYGLRRSGGLDLLHAAISRHYRWVVDLESEDGRVVAADQLPSLLDRYGRDDDPSSPGATNVVVFRELQG